MKLIKFLILHVKLKNDWIVFVFYANESDLSFIKAIISSFSAKLENAICACKNHLELVAKYAKNFGDEFNQGKTCKQLGLIHDIGKRTKKFQDVLFHRNEVHSIDHAIVGAKFFWNHSTVGPFLKAYLSAIIGSHHSDISFLGADYNENDYVETIQTTGKNNALSNKAEYEEILRFIFDTLA